MEEGNEHNVVNKPRDLEEILNFMAQGIYNALGKKQKQSIVLVYRITQSLYGICLDDLFLVQLTVRVNELVESDKKAPESITANSGFSTDYLLIDSPWKKMVDMGVFPLDRINDLNYGNERKDILTEDADNQFQDLRIEFLEKLELIEGLKEHIEGDEALRTFKNQNIVYSRNKDALDHIKNKFLENKKSIIMLDDILPLIKNKDFIDLVSEERISFTSLENTYIADAFSDALMHISNKKKLWRGGNRRAGIDAIFLANKFARKMGPKMDALHMEGYRTLQSKADSLNEKKILTSRKKKWTATAVKNVWERWNDINSKVKVKPSVSSSKKSLNS